MRRRLLVPLAVLSQLFLCTVAAADYLEVRRSALLKEAPTREAESVVRPEVGMLLALESEDQQNGYYHGRIQSGQSGWIYRTLVRRFTGNPPWPDVSEDDEEGDGDSGDEDLEEELEIPGYSRSMWKHWADAYKDCQDTRQEVLIAESLEPVTFETAKQCKVVKGQWLDAYSGETYTNPSVLDVDHMVPLQNAHLSGGWQFSVGARAAYANDIEEPEHLVAVHRSLNRAKGAKGPEAWKPPRKESWCDYATHWKGIKQRWGLTMTVAEAEAVEEMLDTCPVDPR